MQTVREFENWGRYNIRGGGAFRTRAILQGPNSIIDVSMVGPVLDTFTYRYRDGSCIQRREHEEGGMWLIDLMRKDSSSTPE